MWGTDDCESPTTTGTTPRAAARRCRRVSRHPSGRDACEMERERERGGEGGNVLGQPFSRLSLLQDKHG